MTRMALGTIKGSMVVGATTTTLPADEIDWVELVVEGSRVFVVPPSAIVKPLGPRIRKIGRECGFCHGANLHRFLIGLALVDHKIPVGHDVGLHDRRGDNHRTWIRDGGHFRREKRGAGAAEQLECIERVRRLVKSWVFWPSSISMTGPLAPLVKETSPDGPVVG